MDTTRAVRALYGENSGILDLDCTLCMCLKCGQIYIEVLPKGSVDHNKMCHISVEQAKNLGIYDITTCKEYVTCEWCQERKKLDRDSILELLGFFFFASAFVAAIVLVALGAQQ